MFYEDMYIYLCKILFLIICRVTYFNMFYLCEYIFLYDHFMFIIINKSLSYDMNPIKCFYSNFNEMY